MKAIRSIRQAASVVVALAGIALTSALFAPSASALIVRPVSVGSGSEVSTHTAPTVVHRVVTGGMAGWQIALVAIGAALVAAICAVYFDRARTTHRRLRISAA